MKIIVINNYYKPEMKPRVNHITHALRNLDKTKLEIWSFLEICRKKIQDDMKAIVLSGSTAHLQNPSHLAMYSAEIKFVRQVEIPVLGICFGHQLIGKAFDSQIHALPQFIKGFKKVKVLESNEIFSSWKKGTSLNLSQSHRDCLTSLPHDFVSLAESESCKIEAMKHKKKAIYGIQAHIERSSNENPDGQQIFKNFFSNVIK